MQLWGHQPRTDMELGQNAAFVCEAACDANRNFTRTDRNGTRSLITCPPHSSASLIVVQGARLHLFHPFNSQNKPSSPRTNPLSKERGCRPGRVHGTSPSLLPRSLQKGIGRGTSNANAGARGGTLPTKVRSRSSAARPARLTAPESLPLGPPGPRAPCSSLLSLGRHLALLEEEGGRLRVSHVSFFFFEGGQQAWASPGSGYRAGESCQHPARSPPTRSEPRHRPQRREQLCLGWGGGGRTSSPSPGSTPPRAQ